MYLTDIGRQIIIILLLLFIIDKTKIVSLRIIFFITLFIHLYKLFYHYQEYYQNTLKYIYIYLFFFFILLYSLNLFISNDKQIYFIIFFIFFRIITSRLSNYKKLKPILNKNIELLLSLVLILFYNIYSNYKYKNILIMDSINHLLLFIGL